MGGFGSGWRRARTDVVEDCLVLSIADLVRNRVIVPGALTDGVLAWSRGGEQPHARVNYEADLLTDKHAAIKLRYCIDDRNESTHIWLRYTVPQYGGRRWWFSCPLTGDRVAKLYLPPGQSRFASRRAYGLAYKSSRKSRGSKSKKLDVLLRYVAKMRERIRSAKPV
jgi:hypothetical protein